MTQERFARHWKGLMNFKIIGQFFQIHILLRDFYIYFPQFFTTVCKKKIYTLILKLISLFLLHPLRKISNSSQSYLLLSPMVFPAAHHPPVVSCILFSRQRRRLARLGPAPMECGSSPPPHHLGERKEGRRGAARGGWMLDQSLTLQGEEPANNNRICSAPRW